MSQYNIQVLELQNQIHDLANEKIEKCKRDKYSVEHALDSIIPEVMEKMGACGVFIRTYNEKLVQVDFSSGRFEENWKSKVPLNLMESSFPTLFEKIDNGILLIRPLDCVDQMVGLCAFSFEGRMSEEEIQGKSRVLSSFTEQLDNYLETVAAMAKKQKMTIEAAKLLKNPIFEIGVDQAIKDLCRDFELEEFLLVYGDPEFSRNLLLRYRYYQNSELLHSSQEHPEAKFESLLNDENILNGQNHTLDNLIGNEKNHIVPLVNGLNNKYIGKLIIKPKLSGLTPDGTDVIHIFAECLCQRLVDYNRERRYLAKCFSPAAVSRLLSEPDFNKKYLQPREEPIVILFTDISSFTKICEKVCKYKKEKRANGKG